VGVAIVFALQKAKEEKRENIYLKIVKRGIILIALGLFLNLFPYFDFGHIRIPGILQRIGIVYICCSLLYLKTTRRVQFWIFWAILIAYYILLNFVPVPGYGASNLGKETNLAAWLDRLLLTTNHTWKLSVTWDPEGVLSTLPSIATGIFGVVIGYILKSSAKANTEIVLRMIYLGIIAIALGICFHFFFPINKSIWTSSFVLFTGGLATLFFSAIYWWVDVKENNTILKSFVVFGTNAITVFFGSALIAKLFNIEFLEHNGNMVGIKDWLYQSFYLPYIHNLYLASFAGAVTFVIMWYIILRLMHKKNIIIKV
jgi:predicted acyltransferase